MRLRLCNVNVFALHQFIASNDSCFLCTLSCSVICHRTPLSSNENCPEGNQQCQTLSVPVNRLWYPQPELTGWALRQWSRGWLNCSGQQIPTGVGSEGPRSPSEARGKHHQKPVPSCSTSLDSLVLANTSMLKQTRLYYLNQGGCWWWALKHHKYLPEQTPGGIPVVIQCTYEGPFFGEFVF